MMGRQQEVLERLSRSFQIRHSLLRQALAECLGTLILVMFGCGAVAQMLLSGGSHGRFLSVNLAFGVAATLGALVSRQVSGGHLNPAVTFALCLLGREPWRKFPVFFCSQTLGAFWASAIVFFMYFDALYDFGQGVLVVEGLNATAGIFATYPSRHLGVLNGFSDQLIGTAALVVCILAIMDPHNNPVPRGLEAFSVGLVVLTVGLSMGFNAGYAFNPARDFGPRLFTAMAGWGDQVFITGSYWFLVPLFVPFLGAAVGAGLYQMMVGWQVEAEVRWEKRRSEVEAVKLSTIST